MSKQIILLTFYLSILFTCTSALTKNGEPYFEGKIVYKYEYKAKNRNVDPENLNQIYGETATLFFKEGNYLELYDKGFILEQLYNKQANKTYSKQNNNDTLYWFDCSTPASKMLGFKINSKKEKVLGIDCDELVTNYDNKEVSFYFNSDTLRINPEWYSKFIASNKNLNSRKMKAIYLKYKLEYQDFIVTVTATSINNQKLNDNLFAVPTNKILKEDI